jgi:AraC-like DNA-binding protein
MQKKSSKSFYAQDNCTGCGICESIKLLNDTLEYIEKNLTGVLHINEISKVACASRFHFQRMFYALTRFTPNGFLPQATNRFRDLVLRSITG